MSSNTAASLNSEFANEIHTSASVQSDDRYGGRGDFGLELRVTSNDNITGRTPLTSSNSVQHAVIYSHLSDAWQMTISCGAVCA